MDNFSKIDVGQIKVGATFPAPLYFNDGRSMFLAANKTAKPYHVQAIQDWDIPFLLLAEEVLPELPAEDEEAELLPEL